MNSMKMGMNQWLAAVVLELTVTGRLDASFVPWSSDLRLHLLAKYPLPPEIVPISEDKFLEPKWKLSLGAREQNKNWNGDTEPTLSKAAQEINPHSQLSDISKSSNISPRPSKLRVTLRENFRMTPPGHWQDVRRLIFTSEEQGAYSPGDVLTIHPKNHEDDVEQILMRMKWTDVSDQPIYHTPTMVKSADNKHPPPPFKSTRNITLRSLLTTSLDITAIPRRSFFSFIAHFTDDQFQKDRLLEFSKPEYIDEFHDYTTRPRRSILEVLQEFESVKIPWQWAGSVFPELRGRQFSIASGGKHKTTSTGTARFELLVAIVKYKTVIKKVREGVCTRYLASLQVGTSLDITLQQGGLAVKKEEARLPVIMIGPGTGVAPMRSLIWERKLWSQDTRITNGVPASDSVSNIGKSVLFFGCREKHADYFYREEWEEMKDDWLFEVHPAFSRDQSQKIYVQDLIRDHSKSVFEILHHEGGLIYVCGSSGMMPKSVRASLIDVFMNCGDMDQDAAHNFLESLEKQGRYKQETW